MNDYPSNLAGYECVALLQLESGTDKQPLSCSAEYRMICVLHLLER